MKPLLPEIEVSRITGRACSTLQKDRVAGTGIPFVRLGRLVRYRESDVENFIAALQTRHSTSECDASARSLDVMADIDSSKAHQVVPPAIETALPKRVRRQSKRQVNSAIVSEQ